MTNLCVRQQSPAVRGTETDRQPHFGWAAEFVIDLEGNVIKVADGSYAHENKNKKITHLQGEQKPKQQTLADLDPTFSSHLKTSVWEQKCSEISPLLYTSDPDFLAAI